MEKRISINEFRSAVRVAQACNPLITKRNSLIKKIESIQEECDSYNAQVKALESGIVSLLGISVEDIVKKVIVETGTDSNGKTTKITKYLPTDNVTYDEEKKQYIIHIPSDEDYAPSEEVSTVDTNIPDAPDTPSENIFQYNN